MRKSQIPQPKPIELQWRWHDQTYTRRVWRTDWFGDQFEIMSRSQFASLAKICKRFGIVLEQANDND